VLGEAMHSARLGTGGYLLTTALFGSGADLKTGRTWGFGMTPTSAFLPPRLPTPCRAFFRKRRGPISVVHSPRNWIRIQRKSAFKPPVQKGLPDNTRKRLIPQDANNPSLRWSVGYTRRTNLDAHFLPCRIKSLQRLGQTPF
jgi:hypothetical protein